MLVRRARMGVVVLLLTLLNRRPPGVWAPALLGTFRFCMMRNGLAKVTISPSSLWAPITRTGCVIRRVK